MPLALTQDSFFDMDALVARLLGIRLGRLQNHYCTVGSGTDQPTGIVTAAVASGLMNTFPTGETAAIAYDDLVNTMHSVDPAYRGPNSRWMFNDLTLKLLRKLVDSTGRPLWRSGLTSSFVDGTPVVGAGKPEILGVPYVINNDMAVPAANAYSVLFGDMSCFKVREVAGGTTVMVLRERYADYLQIGFIAFERYDSNLVDAGTHPICVGQNSAT
jgi:HK97 family phage major capsid protein